MFPSCVDGLVTAQYHINSDDELISIHLSGDSTLDEILTTMEDLAVDPSHQSQWPHLVDLRGLLLSAPWHEALEFLKRTITVYRPKVIADMAIVADESLDENVFNNLFRLTCAMPRTELFDDYSTALKWLIRKDYLRSGHEQRSAAQ